MYRKFTASRIFNGYRFLDGNPVLVTDESGNVLEMIDVSDGGDDIEHFNGILSPGFINAHCHLELSHLKNSIAEHTGLVEFVQAVIEKREASTEEKKEAMRLAVEEMVGNGIVAVGDICNTADSLSFKKNSPLQWHNFIEITGFVDAAANKRFETAAVLKEHFFSSLPDQYSTLSPHAPYSVSKTLFELINENTAGQLITIHNQESREENKLYVDKSGGFLSLYQNLGIDIDAFSPTGKTSLQTWLPYFNNGQTTILVHNTFTKEDDLAFANEQRPTNNGQRFFCLCPNANRFIEDTLPPINLLRNHHANIVLGTDSYASNHQLSILEEMRTLINDAHAPILLEEALKWATSNGASALRMDEQLGSFKKGKKPGVVLIDEMDGMNLTAASRSRRLL